MDMGSYTFHSLSLKYNNFRGPSFSVSVGGRKLKSTEMPIISLDVELCADGPASGCRIVFECLYDDERSRWKDDLIRALTVGDKLEVKGGYGGDTAQRTIFYGYVDEFEVSYAGNNPPRLEVTGIDGFGYLMSCKASAYGGQKKPRAVVQELLNKAKSAGYAKSVTVGNLDAFDSVPIVKEKIDDYRFLRIMAERYCVSLLCVAGELIFDDVVSRTRPLMTLHVGTGLLSFRKRLSLRGQVGSVVVWGRDVDQNFIKGEAAQVSLGGPGRTAAQIATKFKNAVRQEYNEYVRTAEECQKLAQARLNAQALDFVSGQGVCVGLPELIPGRYISIRGLDGGTEGDYFLSKVRHQFYQDGYLTSFEVKGARA